MNKLIALGLYAFCVLPLSLGCSLLKPQSGGPVVIKSGEVKVLSKFAVRSLIGQFPPKTVKETLPYLKTVKELMGPKPSLTEFRNIVKEHVPSQYQNVAMGIVDVIEYYVVTNLSGVDQNPQSISQFILAGLEGAIEAIEQNVM